MSHDQGRVSVQGVSVQGSLSRGVSVQGVSVLGVSVHGSLCLGRSLSGGLCPGGLCLEVLCLGVSVRETPPLYSNEQVVHILLECILVFCVSTEHLVLKRGMGIIYFKIV